MPSRKSVEAELAEVLKQMRADRAAYFRNSEMQARHLRLIEQLQTLNAQPASEAKNQPSDEGNAAQDLDPALDALMEDLDKQGGRDFHVQTINRTVDAIYADMEEGERLSFAEQFDALPLGARSAIYSFLSIDPGRWQPADDAAIAAFSQLPEQRELVDEWGRHAPRKVATVRGRVGAILRSMTEADRKAADAWLESWSPAQAKSILRALAGR